MLTDEQILIIGRRALDKCLGTDAQYIYVAREVERVADASLLAATERTAKGVVEHARMIGRAEGVEVEREALRELLTKAREVAEWHVSDGDECGVLARIVMAHIDEALRSNV